MNLLLALLEDMALASVPAVGFAMVFTVPRRVLVFCALGGAIGHGLRFLLMKAGVPVEWGTLAAAVTVSTFGILMARKLRAHPKVFTVASMIPMIPGVPLFTALLALQEMNHQGVTPELLAVALNNAVRASFIIGAIALGLAMPGLLVFRRKPIV
ncbi:threonine/serine exporter family protein [Termitidicoccus mucosus]|uniref:Threonine/Serine exporter ThrE domain-containing protein n=1 Tax=Termitidicoccus mucosus TaxID=1184151 RepID=A0A178ILT7_9BACT|nr:hypothetical protein AW736_06800 [Opitutaceae bacterium TSB47]